MHNQLEMLLEIQDLKTQRRELEDSQSGREFEEEVFNISSEDALVQLDEKIGEMEESLDPKVLARYRRLASRNNRPVVPVIKGTCYGCFVSVPTRSLVGRRPERGTALLRQLRPFPLSDRLN